MEMYEIKLSSCVFTHEELVIFVSPLEHFLQGIGPIVNALYSETFLDLRLSII
jgi:hypothetical protein